MNTPVMIRCKVDEACFTRFARYHTYLKTKKWIKPLCFMLMMLAFAVYCFSMRATRDGAEILALVMALIGIGLPAVYFIRFEMSVRRQCRLMKLGKGREVYVLTFCDDHIEVIPAGKRDAVRIARDGFSSLDDNGDCLYLYTKAGKAYLIPKTCLENAGEIKAFLEDYVS